MSAFLQNQNVLFFSVGMILLFHYGLHYNLFWITFFCYTATAAQAGTPMAVMS